MNGRDGSADAPAADGSHDGRDALGLAGVLDLDLDLSVELGRGRLPIERILELGPGSVVELGKLAGEPLDILVGERLIAQGEAVVVGERLGVRITRIVAPGEQVALAGRADPGR